jgi:pimeloyl-ACP methyl ester carboxylesterase
MVLQKKENEVMKILLSIAMCVLAFAGCSTVDRKDSIKTPVMKSGHADVNGIKMYYEIHGSDGGVPLVLLHGGGSSIDVTYSKVLPFFSAKRNVIAIDEQAHGRSSDRNAPVQFDTSADDVAAVLKFLKVEKADVMGFSNGASIAMQVAIRHPQLVRKLIFVSSFTKKSGGHAPFWEFIKSADFSMMPQSLKDSFLKINPDPVKLKNMHDKDAARMKSFKDTADKDVKAIKAHTLIVAGDQDIVRPEHLVEINRMIPGSRLLIIPGRHGDFLGEMSMPHGESELPGLTAGLINQFLDQPLPIKEK